MENQLWIFAGLAFAITLVPGANAMLVVKYTLSNGKQAGVAAAAGGGLGVVAHALASAVGLSLILLASATAYNIVKLLGAAYLVYLGLRSLWCAWRGSARQLMPTATDGNRRTQWQAAGTGVITNLLSAETAIFYLSVVPQFVAPGENIFLKTFLLAGIHCTIRLLWYGAVALLVEQFRRYLQSLAVRRGIEAVSGITLAVLGVRIAISPK